MSINFRKTSFYKVASSLTECPDLNMPEVVLAGRSNVGKSSFINVLGDNKSLAKISSTPGKTQLVVYFLTDNSILFADLPGYGFAKTSNKNKKKYQNLVDNYFNSKREFALVIHFLDVRHSPSNEDYIMKGWLEQNNCKYIIVLTKSDKLSKLKTNQRISEIRKEMKLDENVPILPFSAIKKDGIKEIRKEILKQIEL